MKSVDFVTKSVYFMVKSIDFTAQKGYSKSCQSGKVRFKSLNIRQLGKRIAKKDKKNVKIEDHEDFDIIVKLEGLVV